MKILIIHTIFSPEGARGSEIIAQNSYKILKKMGHEIYYYATDKKPYLENAEWTNYFPQFQQHFSPKWWWNKEAQTNLAKMLDDIKPDIVHIHTLWQLSYSIFKPIFDRKIPIVMTVHDVGILCPARLGWDKENMTVCKQCKGINTLPCLIKNCVLTKKRISSLNVALTSFIEKISGYNKKINKFIVPSTALANYINCKDIPMSKIKRIPNFLNNDFIEKVQFSNKQDYFLYVGTLSGYKGVDILFHTIKELPNTIPFKIVGSGPNENQYYDFVQNNNLSNVEFIGNLDRKNIINYYENCLAAVVPSTVFESFGMINLEAFACKRPVIASRIGGVPEIVEHNKNGLLFEPGNIEQLKECILKYYNDRDLARQHGNNGYNKVQEYYTEGEYYQNLVHIYEEILNESK